MRWIAYTSSMTLLFALMLFATPPVKRPVPPPAPADVAAPPPTAERSPTGLWTRQLAPPTGTDRPGEDDLVRLRYAIWSSDGTPKDFIAPPQSAIVAIPKLVPGFREALLGMKVGEKRRLWIPESLGAAGKVPAGGMLVIDAELLDVIRIPPVPADVAAPPTDATITKSGLGYKVLRAGTGPHPKRNQRVVVTYTGWTTNGSMFDSSLGHGEPAEFALTDVIAGWREGLQLMRVGERARLWIPSRLAYADQPGKPQGMLVFEVELISVH